METNRTLETDFYLDLGEERFHYKITSKQKHLVILGPSGSGKSTFLNALLGQIPVKGFIKYGQFWFSDKENIDLPTSERNLAWLPQAHLLFPHLKVVGNLDFGACSKKIDDERKWIIDSLELGSILEKYPHQISGGESQRVALGRALMSTLAFSEGGLLLLDEPFASLDAELVSKASRFLFQWCEKFAINSVFSVHEIDRIGDFSSLQKTDISAYSLIKSGKETTTKALALPSSKKNV